MLLLRRGLYRITPAHLQSIRALTTNEDDFKFEPKFSTAEQTKILHIVNQANADELSKFDVTRGRIKNLEMWRMKNGPFRTLSDILEVEGLGVKVLERLCNSIILNKTNENNGKQAVNTNRRQFVTPTLDKDVIESIGSIVAIHLSGTGISWAKLQVENNELHTWNFQDFSFLPKKMLPTETYSLAVEILHQLPDADLYVMEASPSMSPQNPQSNKTLPTYTQNLELTSMLLALINSSSKHGMTMKSDPVLTSIVHNKVYYLRAFLSARLFKTLVGNERVASGAIIEKLLARSPDLPCTPIAPMAGIKETFASHSGVHKDLMGQALIKTVLVREKRIINVWKYCGNSMSDPQVEKTLIYLREVEGVAQEILAKKHLKLELSNARNQFNEAYRAVQKSEENYTRVKSGGCFMRLPRQIAIDLLKDDIQTTTQEIDELHAEIRTKVAHLRDLEHQPGIVGIGLKPLSSAEAKAISGALNF